MKNNNKALFQHWLTDESFYSDTYLKNQTNLSQEADKRTLQLFHDASDRVPAYKDFLKKHHILPSTIKTITDFKKLPAMSKENYIDQYPAEKRCWDGNIGTMHMLSTSSGTSGEPYFWPRDLRAEIEGAYFYEFMYKYICNVTQKKTLFINGFAMGTWIAGTFTLAGTNLVAWKGYPITSITPGYDAEPIVKILKLLASSFDQVIITGFVPFLKELVERAINEGVTLKDIPVILIGTGQGITENWREYVQEQLTGKKDGNNIFNIYGSADASIMAVETPLSIQIRKVLSDNTNLKRTIFNKDRLPSLYNFDPRLTYFEEVDGQLHVTKNSGCPLIRYNMLDEGSVIQHTDMLQHFPTISVSNDIQQQLPFVYLFGRDKFMVKIYGANIYTEHVQQALNHQTLQKYITGKYILEVINDEKQNPRLYCRVELNDQVKKDVTITELIKNTFVEEIRKINTEYNDVLQRMGNKTEPIIKLYDKEDSTYFPKGKVKKTT